MPEEETRPQRWETLRQRAEEVLRRRATPAGGAWPDDVQRALHDLEVYQVELELQNEELRRAQAELEAARDMYTDLYEFAPVGYFTLDEAGRIQAANLKGAAMLGAARKHLAGRALSRFVARQDGDAYHLYLRGLFKAREAQVCELRMVRQDGSAFHARLEGAVVGSEAGRRCQLAVSDVSRQAALVETLAHERSMVETIMEYSDTMLAYFDRDFNFMRVNAAYARSAGFAKEELIGRNHFELYPDAENQAIFEQVRASGQPVTIQARPFVDPHQPERGRTYWDWTLAPVKDGQGQVAGLVLSLRDATEREQAEEALRRYELLAAHSRDIILFMRRDDGRILEANAAAIKAYGYSREELLALSIHDLRAPDTRALIAAQMAEADAHGILFETVHRRQDGSTFPVEVSSQGVTIGGLRTLISVVRDISERKQAEEALRRSQAVLAQAGHMAHLGAWEIEFSDYEDVNANPLRWSDEVYRIFGYEPGEVEPTNELFFERVHPDDRQAVADTVQQAIAEKRPYQIEHRVARPDGSQRYVLEHAEIAFDAQGRPLRMIGTVQDITQRKRAEEETLRYVQGLEFLSAAGLCLLELKPEEDILSYVGQQVQSLVQDGTVIVSSFDPAGSRTTVHALFGSPDELERLEGIVSRSPIGLAFTVTDDYRAMMRAGELQPVPGGLFGLTFGQMPLEVCRQIEAHLGLGRVYAMPFAVNGDLLGTIAILTHEDRPIAAAPMIEAFIGMAAVAMQRRRVEEALRESEAGLKRAQEIAHLGSWELDLAQNRLTWSDEVYRIFGLQPQEFGATYEAFLKRVHPDDRAAVDAAYAGSLREGKASYEIEHRVVRQATGEVRWVHEKCQHVADAGGKIVRSLGMVLDTTERKQAEAQIQDLAKFPEENPNPVLRVTRDGLLLYANGASADLLAYWNCAVGGRLPDTLRKVILETLDSGLPREEEADRGERVCSLVFAPVVDGGYVNIYGRDITERKQAEDRLRESEERFRLAQQAAGVGTFEWNIQTGVNRWTPELEAMYGLEAGEFGATQPAWEQLVHPQDRPTALRLVEQGFETGQPVGGEWRVVWPDGSIHWIAGRWQVFKDAAGQPLRMTGVNLDITERKRAEASLAEKAEDLARSNKELEQFAYVASHDLQEPLRMVASYVQLLAERYQGRLDERADRYIAYAVDGAIRMKTLINDLLAYSRVGTHGKPPAPTNSQAILEIVLNNLQFAIEEEQATLTYDPLPTVLADEVQLGQVFQNLIGNALKFRSEAPPRIHVGAQLDAEGEMWRFSVSDNGIGLDPKFAERIFVIFQRLHGPTEYSGTGIGLAICKKIVERHGGRMWVESQPGQGATFYFTMPGV